MLSVQTEQIETTKPGDTSRSYKIGDTVTVQMDMETYKRFMPLLKKFAIGD